MKHVEIGGMCESGYGLETFERMRSEKLGNYAVLFAGPWDLEKLRSAVAFCKEHGMRFVMDETYSRLRGVFREPFLGYDKEEFQAVLKDAGDLYDGSLFMCEYGGLCFYWPWEYVKGKPNATPQTGDVVAARKFVVENLRRQVEEAKERLLPPPLVCIEAAGAASKYLYEAGIDRVDLEVTYDRWTEFHFSAVKGATLAHRKERFGADMAMVWYGGNNHDELWFRRWRVSLYHAWLRGADPVYAEHGIMDYKALGKSLDADSPEVARFRRELADFAAFAAKTPRPVGFPLAKIAFVHGYFDSFSRGEPYVWGQREGDAAIPIGAAEHSWKLFESVYRKNTWQFPYRVGDADFSGNPPYGQADVVPMEAPLDILSRYDALIFLGWNTLAPEYYEKLKDYVHAGGHVLCTLAHLDTRINRNTAPVLFNGGDFNDLFGVRVRPGSRDWESGVKFLRNPSGTSYRFPLWTENSDPKYGDGPLTLADVEAGTAEMIAGASGTFLGEVESIERSPVLTANAFGNGRAFLVHTLEHPGHPSLSRLYADLIGFFAAAHQDDSLRVEAADTVRYAVYEDGGNKTLFLLNTDLTLNQEAVVHTACGQRRVAIPPTGIIPVSLEGENK